MATSPSTALIVRDEAASTLRQAFDAGREGTPQIVIVRGEAGIGKTRLLQEFRREATALDAEAVFAMGQCVDMGEIGSPYTPIRRLLRDLHAQLGAGLEGSVTPGIRTALSSILPEFAPPTASDPAAAPAGADAISDALGALLDALSRERHLVLVIEDLHWADTATFALLKTLSFTLRGAHLTVVMTYRTDDVGRGHPLRSVLADLERNRAVTFIDLERLSSDDAAELTRMLAPDLDDAAVQSIALRSDGLPFFIEELIAFTDSRLPTTLRDLLLARVDTLSTDARAAIDLIAAGGVNVDSDLLEDSAAGYVDRDRLRDGLREGLAANILIADDRGYAFRHALLQEAVHDDLLPSIRSELHARYAEALDRRVADGRRELAAEAAEHWTQAHDVVRAFSAMVTARQVARETAPELVVSQYGERLLASWRQVPDADRLVGMSRLELYAETAMEALDDPRRAQRIAERGLAEAEPTQRDDRASLLNALSYSYANLGDATAARAASVAALSLFDVDAAHPEPLTLFVECLLSRVRTATFDLRGEDMQELERLTDLALTYSAMLDDPVLRARVLDTASTLDITAGRLAEAIERVHRFPIDGLQSRQYQVNLITELDALVRLGRFVEAAELARDWAAKISSRTELLFGVMLNAAEALCAMGAAAEGRRVAEQDLALIVSSHVMSSFGWRVLCLADLWDDRADLAADRRAAHAHDIGELIANDAEELAGWATCTIEGALNAAETAADDAARATLLEEALAGATDLERAQLDLGIARPHLVTAARVLADLDRAGADADADTDADAHAHAQTLARLRTMIDDVLERHGRDEASPAIEALVAAEALRGAEKTVRGADGSPGDAVEAWRAASDLAAAGFVPVRHLWYARYRLAEALLDAGRRDEASALLDRIVADAPAHGIAVVARWARELASRAGLSDAGASRAGLSDLTARERQVLALVAEGLTNSEIGQRLFISPKTASVHISAILTKIGAANRTEAAAIFHRAPGNVAAPE